MNTKARITKLEKEAAATGQQVRKILYLKPQGELWVDYDGRLWTQKELDAGDGTNGVIIKIVENR